MYSHDSNMANAIARLTDKRILIPLVAAVLIAFTVTTVIYAQSSSTRYIPVPQASSGHFHHDIYSPSMEVDIAGVDVYDTLVSAIFQNPYSWRAGRFVYGFHLRVNGDPENSSVKFYISSAGTWHLWTDDKTYDGSVFPAIEIGAYELNSLIVELSGEYATLYLNGEELADEEDNTRFHLGPNTAKGDVWIVNGPFFDSIRQDSTTHYDMFQVLTPIASSSAVALDEDQPISQEWAPAEGKLPNGKPGDIDRHSPNLDERERIPFDE